MRWWRWRVISVGCGSPANLSVSSSRISLFSRHLTLTSGPLPAARRGATSRHSRRPAMRASNLAHLGSGRGRESASAFDRDSFTAAPRQARVVSLHQRVVYNPRRAECSPEAPRDIHTQAPHTDSLSPRTFYCVHHAAIIKRRNKYMNVCYLNFV